MGSKGSKNPHTISILELKLIHLSKNDLKVEKEILNNSLHNNQSQFMFCFYESEGINDKMEFCVVAKLFFCSN